MSRRAKPAPFDPAAAVLARDAGVVVVDKPVGWEVLAADGSTAPAMLPVLREALALPELYPGHRLDIETSGCVAFGVDRAAADALHDAFGERRVRKGYLAITTRVPRPESGRVDARLTPWSAGRRPVQIAAPGRRGSGGREAITEYETLARGEMILGGRQGNPQRRRFALVACRALTGRTHQIRVHLAHVGAALAGDDQYGDRAINSELRDEVGLSRTALHASWLVIPMIATAGATADGGARSAAPIDVTAPLPADLAAAVQTLFGPVDAAVLH